MWLTHCLQYLPLGENSDNTITANETKLLCIKGLEVLCVLLISQGFLNKFTPNMLYKDRKLYFTIKPLKFSDCGYILKIKY